ncbi:MAG: acetate--CoA ligase family protein [Thermoplasmatales archaeon]
MLENLFYPKSIAIVGASNNREKIGNILVRNIKLTYKGKIFPVNYKDPVIENIPAYKSLKEIQEQVDLVIISVPRGSVPDIMEEIGLIGTKAAVIISSGFREVDEKGKALEDSISKIAQKYGIRFLGPNTMGFATPAFNATFAYADVKPGNIAIVAQSGGMGAYMLDWAQKTKTGLSFFVSMGNQTDLNEIDIFQFLANDVNTGAIFTYLEGVADGNRFLSEVPDVIKKKPVIFIKGGTGKYGSLAVKTHTGSIAGSFELFRAAVRTVGGILVENLDDFLNLVKIVQSDEKYLSDILVVTNSGGHGVLTTDEIERQSMNLISIPDDVSSKLRNILPEQSTPKNPLDLSGDANGDRYWNALNIVKDLESTKLVLAQSLETVSCTEVAKVMVKFRNKRIIGVLMGADSEGALRVLSSAGIPAFSYPEDAVKAIKYISGIRNPSVKIRVSEPERGALEIVRGKKSLSDEESLKLMGIYGIKTPEWAVSSNLLEIKGAASKMGFPVVMKISSDQSMHKTDVGGVIMNVDEKNVEEAFETLITKTGRVMVQKQLSGAEVFVGGLMDASFGPAVLVGPGGIYVEVLKSISYGLSPISENEALDMLKDSKVLGLLKARNRNYDTGATIRSVTAISRMIEDLNIKEMDINPLIVNDKGAYAVDVRIVL